jgi:hypothetical protein
MKNLINNNLDLTGFKQRPDALAQSMGNVGLLLPL